MVWASAAWSTRMERLGAMNTLGERNSGVEWERRRGGGKGEFGDKGLSWRGHYATSESGDRDLELAGSRGGGGEGRTGVGGIGKEP